MKVKTVKIDDIKPYPNNPRQNDGEAIDQVADSIKTFGWQQPIVVDKDMVIIVGETRYKAAKKLKLTSVPITVAANLTPTKAKQYRIADNRVGEYSDWDDSKLVKEFDELGKVENGLDHLGFSQEDIDAFTDDDLPDDLFDNGDEEKPQKILLKFGDVSIEINDEELQDLKTAYDQFKADPETSFVKWLLSGGD